MKNVLVLSIVSFFLSGCMFIGLNEDVNKLKESIKFSGKVVSIENSQSPIVVTLSRSEDGSYPLQSYAVVYDDNEFLLSVPKDDYYLLAFEDTNQDFTLQEDERVGWYGSPSLITAEPGTRRSDIVIELRDPSEAKAELPSLFSSQKKHTPVNLDDQNLGRIVDVSAFREEVGPMGMWEPVKYHLEGHSGIYFLEPYDKNKIPVLFVHGITGSGHNWLYLLDQLDREKFQPWIVQYPSGMRLDLLSQSLSQSVNQLEAKYRFKQMNVVAHSMGGLVSRGFLNYQLSNKNNNIEFKTFISISTPWLGHSAASHGAKRAPVVVPSWFDMVPGSPFLESLYRKPLPNSMKYYLLFSHKGKGRGLFGSKNTDGTVTLHSQLPLKAQDAADKVIGFNEGHGSVIQSLEVSKKVNLFLQESLK